MLSNDKNVETIAELIEASKHYLGLQGEYVKLYLIEKVMKLVTVYVLAVLLFALLIVFFVFMSFAMVFVLRHHMSMTGAVCTVAAAQALIILFIYAFRKPWIERPLVRYLAKQLFT